MYPFVTTQHLLGGITSNKVVYFGALGTIQRDVCSDYLGYLIYLMLPTPLSIYNYLTASLLCILPCV